MKTPRILCASGALLALAACDLFTSPSPDGSVGILEWDRIVTTNIVDAPSVEAPDTVAAGVPFQVVVRTFGASGCWSAAGEGVRSRPRLVEITPFDRDGMGENRMCTAAIVRLTHTAQVSFSETGAGTLRVRGRRVFSSPDGMTAGEPVVVEKRVVVR